MKKYILLQLLQKLMSHPGRKKIFISLALVSFVGFIMLLSFVVWLSFGVFGLVKDTAANVTTNSREIVQQGVGKVSGFKVGPDCVNQLQSLSSVNVFLGKPLQETFDKIKTACLPAGEVQDANKAESASETSTDSAKPNAESDWK